MTRQQNIDEVSDDLLPMVEEAVEFLMTTNTLVPVMWGPTSQGKTWTVVNGIARKHDAQVIHVQLGARKPWDVTGFERFIEHLEVSKDVLPEWFRVACALVEEGKNVILFLDELGTARDETREVVYTFLRDGHVRGVPLPRRGEKAFVIGATNPFDPRGALLARCAFIPVMPSRDRLRKLAKGPLSRWLADNGTIIAPPDAEREWQAEPPPVAPIVNAANEAAIAEFETTYADAFFRLSKEARELLIRCIVPEQDVPRFLQFLRGVFFDPVDILEDPSLLEELFMRKREPEIVGILTACYEALPRVEMRKRFEFICASHRLLAQDPDLLYAWYRAPITPAMQEVFTDQVLPPEEFSAYLEETGFLKGNREEARIEGEYVDIFQRTAEGALPPWRKTKPKLKVYIS